MTETSSVEDALAVASSENGISTQSLGSSSVVKVALDPGHCNVHTGASYGNLTETDLTLQVALACKQELETYNNVAVYLTRTTSACPYPSLSAEDDIRARIQAAVAWGADVYVCIHFNALENHTADGAEVYYYSNTSQASSSAALASQIETQLAALGLVNCGVKDYDWIACKYPSDYANIPGVLIEHAFIDGPSDYWWLQSADNIRALGVADATAIAEYYNLSKGSFALSSADVSNAVATLTATDDGSLGMTLRVSVSRLYVIVPPRVAGTALPTMGQITLEQLLLVPLASRAHTLSIYMPNMLARRLLVLWAHHILMCLHRRLLRASKPMTSSRL